MVTAKADAMFYSCKSQLPEKNPVLPLEKCPFLVLARNTITLQRGLKAKTYRTCSSRSGRSRLWEVVAYKRFQI